MPTLRFTAGLVLLLFSAAAAGELQLVEHDGRLTVKDGVRNLLSYQFEEMAAPAGTDPAYARSGFIHPMWSPKGHVLTRVQPPDHYHHYGIWNPWTHVGFDGVTYDLWNLHGHQGTVRFAGFEARDVDDAYAGFTVRHEHVAYLDDGAPIVIMRERQTVRVYPPEREDRYRWDLIIELEAATEKPVTLQEYRYGGFGWRATGAWNRDNSEILGSEGQVRDNIDDTRGRWFLAQGEVDGEFAGALVMSHPDNFNHPEPMRIWPSTQEGDGQVFATFSPTKNTDWVIEPGTTYSRIYRFVVYDGKLDADAAEAEWQAFANDSHKDALVNSAAQCDIPAQPAYEELRPIAKLPDPFLSMDGSRIATREDWACRRAEIAAQVQEFELGPKPAVPGSVSGSMSDDVLTVSISVGDAGISFDARIEYPATGNGPFPAMIVLGPGTGLDASGTISGQGVAKIYLPQDEIAEQHDGSSRGKGKLYELYPGHPAGALIAWAWGASRLIDALETTPAANIDPTRIGVTGCSRYGKGALVVGAFDERIALTIPQESGAGGTSLWRMADVHQQAWIDGGRVPEYGAVQTLAQIVTENVWFRESFRRFANSATRLPFDQHMIMGLVAPRALLVINNSDFSWLDPLGSHFGPHAAREIWKALGVPGRMSASQRGGHPHCRDVPEPHLDLVAAYVARFLVGTGTDETGILYTDGEFPDVRQDWIDWETPDLE